MLATIKIFILTAITWALALIPLAGLLTLAWNGAGLMPPLTFFSALATTGTVATLVTIVRLAWTAPLLTADRAPKDSGRALDWSIIPWPRNL